MAKLNIQPRGNAAPSRNVGTFMIRAGIIAVAILCAGFGLAIRAQNAVSDETIRATVNVVMAPVTVLDRHGDYVSGLQPQD